MKSRTDAATAPVQPIVIRRLAGLVIAGECVAMLARAGRRSIDVSSPVPATASFYTSYFDHSRNAYVAVFEDDSFDRVAKGGVIPIFTDPCSVTEDRHRPGNHLFVDGVCACGQKPSDDPALCSVHDG